jgi:O-Antigen ligase
VGAAIESRRVFSEVSARRVRRGVSVAAIATLVAVLAGGWIAAGNPVTRVRHAWDTFKSPRGYAANASGNRLVSGLGSTRYDFYRVALDEFVAHPLVGIGADNFAEPYLKHRRSAQTPHYPHSVELRTLSQTGVIGALLALVGLGAALVAAARGLRSSDPLGRAVAAAALAGFAYWVVHGSFDWFWEFAGLGAPAFALLGLACALSPRELQKPGARHIGRLGIALGAVLALVAAASLTAPWLSQLQVQSAARIWTKSPQAAYSRLNDAARLNPLSDEAYSLAGSIALRFGDLVRADHEFALALGRTPGDAYATLERGAIASTEGDRARALTLLERAGRLDPRDPLTQQALRLAREGKRVNVEELNRSILLKAQQLT